MTFKTFYVPGCKVKRWTISVTYSCSYLSSYLKYLKISVPLENAREHLIILTDKITGKIMFIFNFV